MTYTYTSYISVVAVWLACALVLHGAIWLQHLRQRRKIRERYDVTTAKCDALLAAVAHDREMERQWKERNKRNDPQWETHMYRKCGRCDPSTESKLLCYTCWANECVPQP